MEWSVVVAKGTKNGKQRSLPIDALTAAEKRVFALIMRGLSSREIANRVDRSPATIRNQTIAIFRKTGVHSRAELIARSKETGRLRVGSIIQLDEYRLEISTVSRDRRNFFATRIDQSR